MHHLYWYRGKVIRVVSADVMDVVVDLGFRIAKTIRVMLNSDMWDKYRLTNKPGIESSGTKYLEDITAGEEVLVHVLKSVYTSNHPSVKSGADWLAEVYLVNPDLQLVSVTGLVEEFCKSYAAGG